MDDPDNGGISSSQTQYPAAPHGRSTHGHHAEAPHAETRCTPMTPHDNDGLVEENIGLVRHIVRETLSRVPSHVNPDDLVSAGNAALMRAARGFDASRGVPFPRYAAQVIRGALLDELRQIDWASRSVRRLGREIDRARQEIATERGRTAEAAEVADRLHISVDAVRQSDDNLARAQVLSLNAGEDSSLADGLVSADPGPADLVEHRERLDYMVAAIEELPPRLRVVVRDYFLRERPMAEIAAELGVSESRISQMRAEALVLLRDALNTVLSESGKPATQPQGCAAQRRAAYFQAVADRYTATHRPAGRADLHDTA